MKVFFAYNAEFAVPAFRGIKSVNWINSAVDLAAFAVGEESPDAGAVAGSEGEGAKPRDEL